MDEIIQYILKSPENTNPNVMRSLLSKITPESGSDSTPVENNILILQLTEKEAGTYIMNKTGQEIIEFCEQENSPPNGKAIIFQVPSTPSDVYSMYSWSSYADDYGFYFGHNSDDLNRVIFTSTELDTYPETDDL